MGKVFVIGNGLDLDLGFSTRYSDFANCAQLWPFKSETEGLAGYLNKKKDTEKWLDIEQCLFEYARIQPRVRSLNSDDKKPVEKDHEDFCKLTQNLNYYIKRVPPQQPINTDSVAAQVIAAIAENGGFKTYSFNYTDLDRVTEKLKVPRMDCVHVHGSVKNDSIILGIDDAQDVYEGYEFLYKVFDPQYRSNLLRNELEEAEEVVFFGHSLGEIDYTYFRTFFKNICREENTIHDRKTVTIFTYDESSRLAILRQLREMNEKKMGLMFNNNDFRIIRTSECGYYDKPLLEEFIKHIHETTVASIGSAV